MSAFSKCAATTATGSCDPTKHVNYNLGMVLGVDDFNQEFSYLSGRDQWMVRDLIGYGTAAGLRVTSELDVKGPRVVVAPGVAVSPCGQMIRVPAAQCAYLNDWLKLDKTKQELAKRNVTSPSNLGVYSVLCYRDCPTDNVPIPGEPCRSEDDLMAASRLTDDFTLELRFDPPDQTEENAVRDFVLWLSQVEISGTLPSTPMADFVKAIRDASQIVSSPPDFMFGSPPVSLVINTADVCRYFGTAYRIWVTELRPKWRPDLLSNWKGCCGDSESAEVPPEECLLLAEVDVPILIPGGGGDWQVGDPAKIRIGEDNRPYLIHLRMLQEWLLCGAGVNAVGADAVAASVKHPAAASSYGIVAAGIVRLDKTTQRSPIYNALEVLSVSPGEILITFQGYAAPKNDGPFQYIVKAFSVATALMAAKVPNINFLEFRDKGIALRAVTGGVLTTATDLKDLEIMVEISQYPFAG
jgi:hypothetical protein